MEFPAKKATVLLADDNETDRQLIEEAIMEAGVPLALYTVDDGEEAIEYLRHVGRYGNGQESPRPQFILLDINMPIKDGRETLREIRADSALCTIPVIVMSTSSQSSEVERMYALGANSFIAKPDTFTNLVTMMSSLNQYWNETVCLPNGDDFY